MFLSSSEAGSSLAKRRLLLGVTGSIAAYKAPALYRLLKKAGAQVEIVLTEAASRFVGAATFRGLGAQVHEGLWDAGGELHVELAQRNHAIVLAPASAESMARLAHGRADDLLAATVLCSRAPLILAPAMHPVMWASAATQDNVRTLHSRGARFIGPVHGEVASGDEGEGRFEEPDAIVRGLEVLLATRGLLEGRRVVVTAGPTSERIDPVRALTNFSSGKMGFALAEQAARQGAEVFLVAGPVSLPTPPGVRRLDVESALEMQATLDGILGADLSGADALIMAAAVADYRPAQPSTEKLKRDGSPLSLDLLPNPDILGSIGRRRTQSLPLLVGFALETATGDALISLGRRKLIDKRADLIVANGTTESLGRDDSRVLLVSAQDCLKLDMLPKPRVAAHVIEWVAQRLLSPPGEQSA